MLRADQFENFLLENSWIRTVELSNWGEVFLNPDLSKIFQIAARSKVRLTIDNGANLNTVRGRALRDLVKYRVRSMTCSIDGASQPTYSIYRQGGDFHRVIRHIRQINRLKRHYRSPFPKLSWQFVAFGHNEHEIELARAFARKLDMDFQLKLSWVDDDSGKYFSPVQNKDIVRKQNPLGVASREEFAEKYGEQFLQQSICGQIWDSPQISSDGRVLGCCVNYWGDFGNAFKTSFKDIYLGEKLTYARKMLTGEVASLPEIPCTTCHYYKQMDQSKSWMKPPTRKDEGSIRSLLFLLRESFRDVWALLRYRLRLIFN